MTQAGLQTIAQRIYHGPAPFLITEAIATEPVPVVPAPHFRLRYPATGHTMARVTSRSSDRTPMK